MTSSCRHHPTVAITRIVVAIALGCAVVIPDPVRQPAIYAAIALLMIEAVVGVRAILRTAATVDDGAAPWAKAAGVSAAHAGQAAPRPGDDGGRA